LHASECPGPNERADTRHGRSQRRRSRDAADAWRRALALWRGRALDGVRLEGDARLEAARLEERRLEALEARVDADLALGRHRALAAELERLIAREPLRERFRAQRMLALYRSGRQADALGVYRDTRATLVESAGSEPGPELRRLEQSIPHDHGVLGCYGIVGGSIATATGAALSLKGSGAVAVAYFGDGATNQAYFFECLNFAKVLRLPVVFVCENNGYGEYTPFESVTAGGIVPRATAMEVPAAQVDGMDVRAVRAAAGEVVDRVRAGRGPEFVEALTYRFVGHSRSDPGKYRPEGELDRWRMRDPLMVAATMLRDDVGVDDGELERIAGEVDAELELIEAAALGAPFPEPSELPEFNEGAA
jgi:TPP-dependent pyruvate/acetoin dehydrogenase alpha subunit